MGGNEQVHGADRPVRLFKRTGKLTAFQRRVRHPHDRKVRPVHRRPAGDRARTWPGADVLRKKGIAIYPVACSGYDKPCEFVMRCCALLTGSQFLFLTDDSGVGNAHAEPSIPYYQVERLERLIVRMIVGELAGQRTSPAPADIIRTVGKKIN